MNYLKRSLSFIFAVCAFTVGSSHADDLSVPLEGIWKAIASTDSGDKHYTITITKEGESLGGNIVEDGNDESRNLDRVVVDGKMISIGIDVEADGQTGEVKVAAKESASGTLTGEWSIVDSTGTTLMGGEWEAKKEIENSLAGTWDSVAELPEGGTLVTVLAVSGDKGDYSGTLESDEGDANVQKLVESEGKVTIDVVMEREGVELEVQIRSELDGNDLIGSWHLSDGNGGDSATGAWKATKRVEFSLEGMWNIVAILPEGDELEGTFEISKDGSELIGRAKIGGGETELKSIDLSGDGEVKITLGYEVEGTAGLVTMNATVDGNNALEGTWEFADVAGVENHDGKWSASRTTEKRGILRGR